MIFRFVIISRYLSSEFTSHEKLNRVKNIFKNCRSILLNNEWNKMSCNDMNKQQIVKENSNIYKFNNKILNCLLMIDEVICKIRANCLISKKFIICTFCWIQYTNQFLYMRKYRCVKHQNNDFINMTKLFVSWCNRLDVSKIQTKCISKIINDHLLIDRRNYS